MTKRVVSLAVAVLMAIGMLLSFAGCGGSSYTYNTLEGKYKNTASSRKAELTINVYQKEFYTENGIKYDNKVEVYVGGTVKLMNGETVQGLGADLNLVSGEESEWFEFATMKDGRIIEAKVKFTCTKKNSVGKISAGNVLVAIEAYRPTSDTSKITFNVPVKLKYQ